MSAVLFALALLAALFVGYNIGGATTAPAFGPAVGASLVSKLVAGLLMSTFFALGAWTIGRRVVDTLGDGIVGGADVFTLQASVIVLGFIGCSLFVGNRFGVPASTSMTTVGAIAGLGFATGELEYGVLSEIVVWWVIAPIIGFAVAVVIGRFFYGYVEAWIDTHRSEGHLIDLDRSRSIPVPQTAVRSRGELFGGGLVLLVGCLMAFSSGSSNVANVIAPLVGSGELSMNPAILGASLAVAAGALTIARRTLETLGNEITELPLPAAVVVATVSAILVVGLSALGIPASFVVIATLCIAGVGWGRTLRSESPSSGPAATDGGESEGPEFDPTKTARVVAMQHVIPMIATVGAYLTFAFLV
ncbi:MAG: inorganic phosphate transporter, partial [Halalkalicoccus sp.]